MLNLQPNAKSASPLLTTPSIPEQLLIENGFGEFTAGAFGNTHQLNQLAIKESNLVDIPTAVIDRLPNLQFLDLRDNNLTVIPSLAFLLNEKLEKLWLSGNLVLI